MLKKTLILTFILFLALAGCTPTITQNTDRDQEDSIMPASGGSVSGGEEEIAEPQDGKEPGAISFNTYTNPATGYSIDIPTNWYWQHFHKGAIGADSTVNDFLLISPTHAIAGLGTESPAEIIVEVSSRPLSDFSVAGEQETAVSVAGQSGVKVSTIVNNEVFDNFQKIEYRFTRNGQTYRVFYLADAGLENNETVFEQMVASLKFGE